MKKFHIVLITILGLVNTNIAQTIPKYVPSNGLVGWWPFNGNANDLSGNGNNGNVNGPTMVSDRYGKLNSAYSFDGINDYISTNKWITGKNNNYSISFWMNLDSENSNPTDKSIILHRADWGDKVIFWSNTPQSVVASDRHGSPVTGISNIAIKKNVWEHLLMVSSSTSINIYVNGILKNSAPRTTLANWDSLYQGSYFGGNGFDTWQGFINAKLDDIGIWDRSLKLSEIQSIYNSCDILVSKNPRDSTIQSGTNTFFDLESSYPLSKKQWQTDLGVGFQNISNAGQYSGANNDTLIVNNTTLSNNNQKFRCIVNLGSCSDTSKTVTLKVIKNLSIQDNFSDNIINLFPNPSDGSIFADINSNLVGSTYDIYNSFGQLVIKGRLSEERSFIDIKGISEGIYFLILDKSPQYVTKIIKLR